MAYDQNALDQIFQSTLGRASTSAEQQFLKPYIDNGTISPYQVGQYLQATPEAIQSRIGQQQQGFANTLTAGNNQILGQAADAANASFAQNGRQFSSGQGNAVLQAGQQLAAQQSPLLAQNYMNGQGYLNDAYNALGGSNVNNAINRTNDLTDSYTAYQRQQALYAQGANDYQNLLRQQSTRGLQQGLMSLAGAGVGAAFGGGFGGMAGAKLGAGVGSLF